MAKADRQVRDRLSALEQHLREENEMLVKVVSSYRDLDSVGYSLGLIDSDQSYALQVSWWPMIAVLGPFSAGKSSFINSFLQMPIQEHGAQAVDDKFTAICYGKEAKTLPGAAMDADPRFPFYRIRETLEKVEPGEGDRLNSYLQLKTCPSERAMKRILIDSPGFDADSQRSSTLRLTNYVMDLSDLVLVLFDARRPEPGAMRDTLQHLVEETINREDHSKFMYILNQIDTTANEDNPEEIVAAWQRAMGSEGLTAGKFYTIYNSDRAWAIENEQVRQRFESKRDADLAQIYKRINEVGIERNYNAIARLENTVQEIRNTLVPILHSMKSQLRSGTRWRTGVIAAAAAAVFLLLTTSLGYWQDLRFTPPWDNALGENWWITVLALIIFLAPFVWLQNRWKKRLANRIGRKIPEMDLNERLSNQLASAWQRNTRGWINTTSTTPKGWNGRAQKKLDRVMNDANGFVLELNNIYTDLPGKHAPEFVREPEAPQEVE